MRQRVKKRLFVPYHKRTPNSRMRRESKRHSINSIDSLLTELLSRL